MEKNMMTWRQRSMTWLRLVIRLLITVAVLFLLRRFGPGLLDLTMPFLLGWLVAVLLDVPVRWVQQTLGLSRKVVSLILVFGILVLAGGSISALIYYTGRELMDLLTNWDVLFDGIQSAAEGIDVMFVKFFSLVPPELTATVDAAITGVFDWLQEAIPAALKGLGERATDKFMGVPSFVISFFFFLMGAYFITADYPDLCRRASGQMSRGVRDSLSQIRSTALVAFGGYLRAQLLLSFGVFCILLLGFLVTGQQYSLLLAFALSVLDFIPLLGAGTAMIPWAVFSLLTHNYSTAISVAVIWGIIALYRRFAEPKIVGDQTGLSPILSLISIYVGMKLGGVLGMILGPIVVLVLINLGKTGMFSGVWADLRAAAGDLAAVLAHKN